MQSDTAQWIQFAREVVLALVTLVSLGITTWSAVKIARIKGDSEQILTRTDRRKYQNDEHPVRRESDN